MSSRERLLAAFRSQPVDRVPVKVWGATPWTQVWHPSYRPILEAALARTDLACQWSMDVGHFMTHPKTVELRSWRSPSSHDGYVEQHELRRTPLGDLHTVTAVSDKHLPPYIIKHPVNSVEDARRFLSIPYVPMEPDVSEFFRRRDALGERGIMIAQIDIEPIYAVQMLLGSERLALWLLEERDLVSELVACMAERVMDRVRYLLDRGLGPVFGYYGPELCTPPLARLIDFQEFVVDVDKRFIDPIKEMGGLVWVHCHGKMRSVIEGFVAMGVDCLNPIEPPPMGDLTLKEAREIVGDRLCLEGNLEPDDMARAPAGVIREQVARAMEAAQGGGFILLAPFFLQSATASEQMVRNYLVAIEAGLRLGGSQNA